MFGVLYLQSEYSMLHSTLQLEALFHHAKSSNYDIIPLTDEGNLHGMYKFLKLAAKNKIKPILGLKLNLEYEGLNLDFLVYAKNDKGLETLIELSSSYKATSVKAYSALEPLLKRLMVVFPTNQKIFINEDYSKDLAFKLIMDFKSNLNEFYIGLSLQNEMLINEVSPMFYKFAKELNIKTLPLHQTTYFSKDEKITFEVLKEIESKTNETYDLDMSFKSKDELILMFKPYKDIFKNLEETFKEVKYTYLEQRFDMPIFPTKEGVPSKDYLEALATKGLERRLIQNQIKDTKIYHERLKEELSVIIQMGYPDYFLIVYDFVRFAKQNDILVGPGRGSAAGSLVAYSLGITDVDPIKYDLLFERFLNKERQTMPDIDLDFPDNKRDLVIEYVKNKYGKNHVVSISTFTTFAFKSSIRDVGRIMKLDPTRVSAIIKSIESNKLDSSDLEAVELKRVAEKLEGLPRQTGTHAAGIILSKQDLTKYVPLQEGPHDMLQSQLEASDLESLGFLKIDFLGLRNLSIIEEVIKKEDGKIKLNEIPLDDQATFETLRRVDTTGIFQLESPGMRNVIGKLKPEHFEDLVAILALFRPGPLDFIDTYIKRRHQGTFDSIDPSIDEILRPTFGIIVYQEQIMKIAQVFAGFSLSEADLLRRGIAKKDEEILKNEKQRFIDRSLTNGRNEQTTLKIYEYIERFKDYGFNRSHSVAYALLAYQMAYLKTHYYKTFMSVLMTSVVSNKDLVDSYLRELSNKHIEIYPPNIEISGTDFDAYKDGVILPLTIIKGVGQQIISGILSEREKSPFKDYRDFKNRLKDVLNQKSLAQLIKSGALDVFGLNHASMLENSNLDQSGFENFLSDFKEVELDELPFETLKDQELEVLGFNLTYTDNGTLNKLKKKYDIKERDLKDAKINTIAKVLKVRIIKTKQNQQMAFVDFDDGARFSGTIFPSTFTKYQDLLNETYLLIEGDKDDKGVIIRNMKKVKV
ncbi:DNA polymerase III subunit alpha [Acholeplasma equirhinis]|nr:DNA polymerase III subunit alpha [Acholeplasma equirhinis]MBN3490808.1 DNA polymerase III subunit alpha [Acholeplasma equirhinis]